jgi:hypothetical protein
MLREKKYNRIQIAGQMNDWTPSRTPDLQPNAQGLYEVELLLSPGTYLYQMNLDGDQNHDANNPQKVDNGFGKYNSILEVPGKSHLFPVLFTEKTADKKIMLTVQNEVTDVKELISAWKIALEKQTSDIANIKNTINENTDALTTDIASVKTSVESNLDAVKSHDEIIKKIIKINF